MRTSKNWQVITLTDYEFGIGIVDGLLRDLCLPAVESLHDWDEQVRATSEGNAMFPIYM